MVTTELTCRVEQRRKQLFANSQWNGIDFVEVSDDQLSLCVHFFGSVPETLTLANIRIEGGRRIREIRAVEINIEHTEDPELDDCLCIKLDKIGDFSIYRLCLIEPLVQSNSVNAQVINDSRDQPLRGFDPRYACVDFSFKVDCPSDLDCNTIPECEPAVFLAPQINYLAKDYASFRQLIFDRLALTLPDWQERHVPDIGVTLVELLAYAADYLSYYQDAVATEAYLDTARQRISVRRHARLVDYRMHEGNNARAWITVWTSTDLPGFSADSFYFITGFPGIMSASGNIVSVANLEQIPRNLYEVFEPLVHNPAEKLQFFAAHSEIRFYTWGDLECCLPAGATRATLLDQGLAQGGGTTPLNGSNGEAGEIPMPSRLLHLKVGDILIFEEVLGPTTGNPADANPTHRHAVRLTRVTQAMDGLLNQYVLEIEWAEEDALPFSLCLSARLPAPDCRRIEGISVARGNVVLVDHGRSVTETLEPVDTIEIMSECSCDGSVIERSIIPERFNPVLQYMPLSFGVPLPVYAPATKLLAQDPRDALPKLMLQEYISATQDMMGPRWSAVYDLLDSGSDERHVVVELDDDSSAHLRFGDGELGRKPAAGTRFQANYRVGNGPAGNVGRDSIGYLVFRNTTLSADMVKPRNPLPAQGGTAREPSAEVKLFAPHAFRARRERAITAADYAELAQRNVKLQRAAAELRWTGSWYEAHVAIDALDSALPSAQAGAALLAEIKADLFRYRRMGHDLAVVPAQVVPLHIAMKVCVLPHYARGQVKAELLKVFSNRRLVDGKLGFFHPDRLSFGEGIYLSQLIAAAKGVAGVETLQVTQLRRLHAADNGEIEAGVLPLGSMEVAQLDNDPSFPENGRLEITLRGGR